MNPSRLPLPLSSRSRWLLMGLLLLLGPACARRVEVEAPKPEAPCCTSVGSCLELLGESKGPIQDTVSLPLERLDPLKRCAAHALRDGGREAQAGLVALLSHPDPQVRSGAALGLSSTSFTFGGGWTQDAVPALLHAYQQGPRELPLATLVRFNDARVEPALRHYLQEGPTQSGLSCVGPKLAPGVLEVLEAPDVTAPVLARGMDILCGVAQELVPRVRALLRRELARPTLWRAPGPSCQEPLPRSCQLILDDCMPTAGAIAKTLSDGARHEVYPEFLEALARDDARLTPLILHYLARTPSPEFDAWRARLLESPIPDCRQHALRRIRTPPPQAREVIQSLLERGAPWERAGAAELLARFGDDQAIEALRRALDDPHAGVQNEAARALGSLKQKASAALPRLDELAATHASPYVRLSAAVARFSMTGQWTPPATPPCPKFTTGGSDPEEWELQLRTGPLRLHKFRRPPDPLPAGASGPCAGITADSRHPSFVPMDQACLVLNPRVEGVGASTWVSEKGRHIILDHWGRAPNPEYVLEFQGKRLVAHGLLHLGINLGDLSEVAQTPQGGWMMTLFAPLPGSPIAHAMDSQGDLVVAAWGHSLLQFDPGTDAFWRMEAYPQSLREDADAACLLSVVRITRDGQVFDVE